MAFVNSIDIYGEDAVADAIISANFANIGNGLRDDGITSLGRFGLAYIGDTFNVLDLPNLTIIEIQALAGCSGLHALILRNSVVCVFDSSYVLRDTAIANGKGYIYVPAALIDTYKSSTNASQYAAQFRALEDYTVDGTIWGDLDEAKIAA